MGKLSRTLDDLADSNRIGPFLTKVARIDEKQKVVYLIEGFFGRNLMERRYTSKGYTVKYDIERCNI